MSRMGWRILVVGVALTTMATTNASAQNHFSIPDNLGSQFADIRNEPDGDLVIAQAYGTAYNNVTAPTNLLYDYHTIARIDIVGNGINQLAQVTSAAFEPDKVQRGYARTKVFQNSDAAVSAVAARILTVGGITATVVTFPPGTNTSAAGCKSKITMKDAADNAPAGNYSCVAGVCAGAEDKVFNRATAKTQCDNAGLASLGLASAARDIVVQTFPPNPGKTGFNAVAKNLPNVAN